jgi:hypothetical protein
MARRHVPFERGVPSAVFPLSSLPEPTWEFITPRPLVDAEHMVVHTAHTVYAWLAESADGPPLDPALRVRARALLPSQQWSVRFYTRDLRRVLRNPPHALWLRVVCAGVAEQSSLLLIT